MDLVGYLRHELGFPVQMVQATSFQEANDMVQTGYCDMAFVSAYAYVAGQRDFGMQPVAIPESRSDNNDCSYLIVPVGSKARTLDDMAGKVFAFSDPRFSAGYLFLRARLSRRGITPGRFFKQTIFTNSDDNSVRAVAGALVDGASVSSFVYGYMKEAHPQITGRTRIIEASPPCGVPLFVARPGLSKPTLDRVQQALLTMSRRPLGQVALNRLGLRGLALPDDRLYNALRVISRGVQVQR
jgi:phosphonate transport system substrate-binding protein